MAENSSVSDQNQVQKVNLQFGEQIEIEAAGFSFKPIDGFELEINGSVYMYSTDGNLEISLLGGELDERDSIVELNKNLSTKLMKNFDSYKLIESGTDNIQGVTGFLNTVQFENVEEKGLGRALICSPYINQFFYILVIATADYWHHQGDHIFSAIKSQIQFHSQFKPINVAVETDLHPDLKMEIVENLACGEEFSINIERDDVSFLLAARSFNTDDIVTILSITAPGEKQLYHYDLSTGVFSSTIYNFPVSGNNGEVCLFFPRTNQQSLTPGAYRFAFATDSGSELQEVQTIVRTSRASDLQMIDSNFWFAMEQNPYNDPNALEKFEMDITSALAQRMSPYNLSPGRIECFHPAPDELEAFATINLETDLADCSYMIAETVSNGRALNIGLFDQIHPSEKTHAASSGSPGMIMSSASPHSCIVIDGSTFVDHIEGLADTIIEQMIHFSGIDVEGAQKGEEQALTLDQEIARQLRLHPLFYKAG